MTEYFVGDVEKLALVSFGSKHIAMDESDCESLTIRLSAGKRPTNGHKSTYIYMNVPSVARSDKRLRVEIKPGREIRFTHVLRSVADLARNVSGRQYLRLSLLTK